jgi:hypothetical protein
MQHIFSYSHNYNFSVQNSLVIISLITLAQSPTYWRPRQSKVPLPRIRPTLHSGQSNRCQLPYCTGVSHSATRKVMYSGLFIILLSYVIRVLQISYVTDRKRDKEMVNKDVYFGITHWVSSNVVWHFAIAKKTITQNKSSYQMAMKSTHSYLARYFKKKFLPTAPGWHH